MTTTVEYKKSEQEILPTVANVRYFHLAQPWDSPLAFGVQAFIEYNGFILNDRHQTDFVRVTGISGLDDPEVRDNRTPRPSRSGEYVYDRFYGGRNLVLNGFIESGSLSVLKTIERNLKAAFASLNENQLKFRWFDVFDPLQDPNTILEYSPTVLPGGVTTGNYSPLIGSLSNLKIENGSLSWKSSGKNYFIRTSDRRTYCDTQITLKCTKGEKDKSYIGLLPCVKNEENYLIVKYKENSSGSEPELIISTVNSGVESVLITEKITASLEPIIGQTFWLRSKKEGNKIIAEFWNHKPHSGEFPTFSSIATLAGEDEENYGDEIISNVGIAGNQENTYWSFNEFRIDSLYPGDVEYMATKMNLSMRDEQTTANKFKRSFQITMRASDFRAFSSTSFINYIYITSSKTSPSLARVYPRSYPLKYNFFNTESSYQESNILSINNRGSSYIEPIIYVYGPAENILLTNLANGESIEWLGKINSGDYIVINCKEETIVNSLGSNYIEPLVPSVEWMKLEPMWNDIHIQGYGFSENVTKLAILARHGYL